MAVAHADTNTQIRLRLTTREQDIALVDSAPILVPTNFRRYQLSTLVNGLVGHEQAVPFEFLVNGDYLRSSLEEYLNQNGVSAETTLSIEYVRARLPPQYVASFEHDDWISDVDVSQTPEQDDQSATRRILTSSYDGRIRIWNTSSQVKATSPSGAVSDQVSPVKCARFVTPTQIVSCGWNRSIQVWSYHEKGPEETRLSTEIELLGHEASVDSLSVHVASQRILTGSADHTVGLWSMDAARLPAVDTALVLKSTVKEGKRRKVNTAVAIRQGGPLKTMQRHNAPVSGVAFDMKDPSVGYSSSHDHTVRTWDLVTSALVDTRTTSNMLYCIEQMPQINLLAAGSAGRDIKLVDPRASASTIVAMSLTGHKNHVVALARDPNTDYGLLSGSHDGTCRVWDVRSNKSIYTITRQSLNGAVSPLTGEGVKVFGVCWDREIGILSGGEDKTVQINSGSSSS